MTTKVTVDAHAGWPVRVLTMNKLGVKTAENIVQPNTTQDFYIHSDAWLKIVEQPKEYVDAAA